MTTVDIKIIAGLGILLLLLTAFYFQIHRIWRIRIIMKNFLNEMEKLNDNLENIITYIHGKSKSGPKTISKKEICKNCIFRLTYADPDSPEVFFYQCKLDKRKITLKDTCKRFQKDLQNTQI